MLYCYYALHPTSWWARRIREGGSPSIRAHPSTLWQTRVEAWGAATPDYLTVRWEWRGETNKHGNWLLTNPRVVMP